MKPHLPHTELPDQTLGVFIKNKRQEANYTIRGLADCINKLREAKTPLSPGFLSEIENGRRFPSDELFSILAKVLKVQEDFLRRFDQRMPADELKELQAINPQFGFAFRRAVQIIREGRLTPKQVLDRLSQTSDNDTP